ncbi:MAG: hypothetical protein O2819_01075 [Planctomycetota bacterium]|nr:hypothetical protein [Planctomycetota bacterium]MDA1105626.1 hypothetical protein [Planctomycetota bacterium]
MGPAIGIAGGVYGSWNSLRKCTNTAQRRVIWKWTVIVWLAVGAMLGVSFMAPAPWGSSHEYA